MVSCYWFKFEPNTNFFALTITTSNNLPRKIYCKNIVKMLRTYHFSQRLSPETICHALWECLKLVDVWDSIPDFAFRQLRSFPSFRDLVLFVHVEGKNHKLIAMIMWSVDIMVPKKPTQSWPKGISYLPGDPSSITISL